MQFPFVRYICAVYHMKSEGRYLIPRTIKPILDACGGCSCVIKP